MSYTSSFIFPATTFKTQLILGTLCGILNYALLLIREFFQIPLFLDTVFTMFASLYGLVAGCLAAYLCHLFTSLLDINTNIIWTICSLTIVLIFRFFFGKRKKVSWIDIICVIILTVVLITIEGTIIATALAVSGSDYLEPSSLSTSIFTLLASGMPYFTAAFLVRLPVNLIDKTVSLIFSLMLYFLISKIKEIYSKAKE